MAARRCLRQPGAASGAQLVAPTAFASSVAPSFFWEKPIGKTMKNHEKPEPFDPLQAKKKDHVKLNIFEYQV